MKSPGAGWAATQTGMVKIINRLSSAAANLLGINTISFSDASANIYALRLNGLQCFDWAEINVYP
jgi:hypothetical protein